MAGPRASVRLFTQYLRYHPKLYEIKSTAKKYLTQSPFKPNDMAYQQALCKARKDFSLPRKVHPFHINDAIKHYQNTDRSPGLPYTTQGFHRKDEVDPLIIKQWVHNLKYGKFDKCNTPCTAAVKTVVSKKPKFRLIWVYPAHMTFSEGMFAMPLIQAYLTQRGPYGLWLNYALGDMRLLMCQRQRENLWLGADWSGFDACIPAWLIRDAFQILWEQLDVSRYYQWGVPTDKDTLRRLWHCIVKYFINTPLRFQDGEVIRTRKGVPSGSYFTSLIDSVVNSIVWHYLLGSQIRSRWFVGDDALLEIEGKIDMKLIANNATRTFGLCLNLDKTGFGTHVSFLGYQMGLDGRPQASYDKLMAQLLLPARPDHEFSEFVARARALQLSCFGLGCWRFTCEAQVFIDAYGLEPPKLHPRHELSRKLKALDMAHWPPLHQVMLRF